MDIFWIMVVVVGRGCNGRYGWDGGKMEGIIKLFRVFGNGLTDGWMDIEGCRVAFVTEHNKTKSC